jgi:ssDNA-binding Zn-finger/Zn-ribbon topoisomerase 1
MEGKFCPDCGTKCPASAEIVAAIERHGHGVTCPNCGAENQTGRFCTDCGAVLRE